MSPTAESGVRGTDLGGADSLLHALSNGRPGVVGSPARREVSQQVREWLLLNCTWSFDMTSGDCIFNLR